MAAIDWYRATLEFLKGNKVLLLIVTALLGIGGNIYQAAKPSQPATKIIVEKPNCHCLKQHIKEHH